MTEKQLLFTQEYILDLNATKAAIRAGYNPNSAKSIGSENLTKPDILATIKIKMAERSKKTGVTADQVLQHLAAIAFSNIGDIVQWDQRGFYLIDSKDIPNRSLLGIKMIELKNGAIRLSLDDRIWALEMLGRHLGLFK